MVSKQTVLITDDSEMNRAILTEMLSDEYNIIEAENGEQAIAIMREHFSEISVMLLDIIMPKLDGFEVLQYMNEYNWIKDIPVVMISADVNPTNIKRAYDLGAVDYINRPFDVSVVRHRVINTIMIYAKQRRLVDLVTNQIYEKEKSNNIMISILSHIVEFRNGESGQHVLHVQTITEVLLETLKRKSDAYNLSRYKIGIISTASALHDIGKITISDAILNKPGKLTKEEFDIMKTHSMEGAKMLENMDRYQNEPLVKVAYQICRWHHERYDGRGYPDGLKGDEIPISAQVVSVADVYDALTSERCYKPAFTHEQAIKMITNGECGTFNPLLIECLLCSAEEIQSRLCDNADDKFRTSKRLIEEVAAFSSDDLVGSESVIELFDVEREKYEYLENTSEDIILFYDEKLAMYKVSGAGADRLNIDKTLLNPSKEEMFQVFNSEEDIQKLRDAVDAAVYGKEEFSTVLYIIIDNTVKEIEFNGRTLWQNRVDGIERFGFIGRVKEK